MQELKTFILLSGKPWNDELFEHLRADSTSNWIRISEKEEFTFEKLTALQPSKIFIPHWSYIIPKEIYENFECIVFHMTNLPYGRGGSPLQNLIVQKHRFTKISAIRVEAGIDTGDIYLKKDLTLDGTASDIFYRASLIMEVMIAEILEKNLQPTPQEGEPVLFKRRKPEDSDISQLQSKKEIYDYIRMLDADGYPKAFLETENFRFEFEKVEDHLTELKANVRIIKK